MERFDVKHPRWRLGPLTFAVGAAAALYANPVNSQAPPTPGSRPMSVDARLQHLEYRMTGLEAVSFRRQGEHYELTINGARLVVGPKGDVTVHSPTQVSLVSSAGGVMRLERSMSLESYKPPVARYGGQKTKCNPPYKIDKATGVRSVKPECLYTRR